MSHSNGSFGLMGLLFTIAAMTGCSDSVTGPAQETRPAAQFVEEVRVCEDQRIAEGVTHLAILVTPDGKNSAEATCVPVQRIDHPLRTDHEIF